MLILILKNILDLITNDFFKEMFNPNVDILKDLLISDKETMCFKRCDNWFRLLTTQIYLKQENII